MQPTVSVIIPSYNSGHFVVDAVESALRQTVPPTQIIVVNDGSTDDTDARLAPYADRITIVKQPNAGLSAARNAGLRIATGDWIGFLDADDAWGPRKIELQLAALERDRSLGMIGTNTFDFPTSAMPDVDALGETEVIPLERLLVRNYFTASSVLASRAIATRVGDFDTSLPNAEDLDYWQRAAEFAGVAILRQPLTGYRQVPGSLSRRPVAMETGIRRVLQKLDDRDAWRGRRMLRRRAFSHLHYSCAHLYGVAGYQGVALQRMLQSFAWYPLPYARYETSARLARPKRAAVLALRLFRLAPPDDGLPVRASA